MKLRFDVQIAGSGDIQLLARILNVFALYDLTPRKMSVRAAADGLTMRGVLVADARSVRLSLSRVRALLGVTSAAASPDCTTGALPRRSDPTVRTSRAPRLRQWRAR